MPDPVDLDYSDLPLTVGTGKKKKTFVITVDEGQPNKEWQSTALGPGKSFPKYRIDELVSEIILAIRATSKTRARLYAKTLDGIMKYQPEPETLEAVKSGTPTGEDLDKLTKKNLFRGEIPKEDGVLQIFTVIKIFFLS